MNVTRARVECEGVCMVCWEALCRKGKRWSGCQRAATTATSTTKKQPGGQPHYCTHSPAFRRPYKNERFAHFSRPENAHPPCFSLRAYNPKLVISHRTLMRYGLFPKMCRSEKKTKIARKRISLKSGGISHRQALHFSTDIILAHT